MLTLSFAFFFYIPNLAAHEVHVQAGSLKGDIAPAADFAATTYRHAGYRVGAFTSPNAQGVVVSYMTSKSPFILELGQREKSLDQGFLISNGAYLPWTKNFVFAEPVGVRSGYKMQYLGIDAAYYQRDLQNVTAGRLFLTPASWFKISGGVAARDLHLNQQAIPLAAIEFGNAGASQGFTAAAEYAGESNVAGYVRYSGDFTVRGLAFRRGDENPFASGIYAHNAGLALQFMSDAWFAQFFSTESRFGMLRYGGEFLTAVSVYEEKTQLAGFSLRNSATGFHLRSGATVAADGSLQTLAGLGYAEFVFIGGGHYALNTDQPLEPIIFPSDWYSSVLLQSTSMRIKDRGFKMMALVNTEAVQGFFAVTYAEDVREREKFGFYLRLCGSLSF